MQYIIANGEKKNSLKKHDILNRKAAKIGAMHFFR